MRNLKKSRSKQIIEKRKFIKCIESNEIYSSKEWVYMGYHDAYRVANGELRTTLKSGGFLFSLQRLNLHNQLTSNRLCSD